MSWNDFFDNRIYTILKNSGFDYNEFRVTMTADAKAFVHKNNSARNKVFPVETLLMNVKIEDLSNKGDYAELDIKDIPVLKLPIETDNGFNIRGSRYHYLNEIAQSKGWYLLQAKKKLNNNYSYSELNIVSEELPDESEKDELESKLDLEEEDDKYLDEEDTALEEELNEVRSKLESLDSVKEVEDTISPNAIGPYLYFRGEYGKSLIFSIELDMNGKEHYLVTYQYKGVKKQVDWSIFLRALNPELTYRDLVSMFGNFNVTTDCFIMENSRASSGSKVPSAMGSSEDCAKYVLSQFYGYVVDNGNSMEVVDNPIEELHKRLNRMFCTCPMREEIEFSFLRLNNVKLSSTLNEVASKEDYRHILSKIGEIPVGTELKPLHLAVLEECKSIKKINVEKNGKIFEVRKSNNPDTFVEQISEQFYRYLLLTEDVVTSEKMDAFTNKIIQPFDAKIEEVFVSILDGFRESFIQTCDSNFGRLNEIREELSKRRGESTSIRNLNVFIPCFKVDVNVNYYKFIKKLQSDSTSQQKDDTNSISHFAQRSQAKYGLSKEVPVDLRELQEDQYGFICPFSTSEGQNIGLNLYMTNGIEIKDEIPMKKFYVLKDGKRVKNKDGYEYKYLSCGQVIHSIVADAPKDPDEEHESSEECDCAFLMGDRVPVTWELVQYQEISSMQNVSVPLSIIPSFRSNGGKRGVMSVSTLKSIYPLINGDRAYCTTGAVQNNDIGIIRAKVLLVHACTVSGVEYNKVVNKNTNISIEDIDNSKEHRAFVKYSVNNCDDLSQDVYSYDVPSMTPTAKRALRHAMLNVNETNIYYPNDIVIHYNDTKIEKVKVNGKLNTFKKDTIEEYDLSIGKSVKVAFLFCDGWNYEDSMEFGDQVIEEGYFDIVRTFTIKDEIPYNKNKSAKEKSYYSNVDGLPHLNTSGLAKVGEFLKVGDIVMECVSEEEVDGKIVVNPRRITLKEGRKDKGYVISNYTEVYTKEDGTKWMRASVTFAYVSPVLKGDKFTGGHGNKGILSKEVPRDEMFYIKETGEIIDIVLNPTGVMPRANMASLLEHVMGRLGHTLGEVMVLEPFVDVDITELLKTARLNNVKEVTLVNGKTGKELERKVFVGEMYIYRSEHDVKGKYNCEGGFGPINETTLATSRCQGGGQRVGEQSNWSYLANGCFKLIDSFFSIQGSDIQALEEFKASNGKDVPLTMENNLVLLMKVYYRLMGVEFEDFNKGMFRIVNNELVESPLSSFMPNNSTYDIDGKEFGRDVKSKSELLSARSTFNSASINLKFNYVFPTILESNFILWNMWYFESKANPESSALGNMEKMCNRDSKYNKAKIGNLKHMSSIVLKELIAYSRTVVWVKGVHLPYIVDRRDFVREQNRGHYNTDKFFAISGYMGALSVLLGKEFLNNLETGVWKSRSFIGNLVIGAIYGILNPDKVNEGKNIGSYSVKAYFRDMLGFIEGNSSTVSKDLWALQSGLSSALCTLQKSDIYLPEFFLEGGADSLSNELNLLTKCVGIKGLIISDITTFECGSSMSMLEFYNKISCKWFWIPPKILRKDSLDGKQRSMLQLRCLAISKRAGEFEKSTLRDMNEQSFSNINLMYAELCRMRDFCIDKMKNHKTRNAEMRDLTFSVRVRGSGRGYITVNPELNMDEARVPFRQIARMCAIFLSDADRYSRSSLLGAVIHNLSYVEDAYSDEEYSEGSNKTKNAKKINDVITYIASENKEALYHVVKSCEEPLVLLNKLGYNVTYKGDANLKSVIYDIMCDELIAVLNELLEGRPVVLARAPELWKYSDNAFNVKVTKGYSIELTPLACTAFNADFDGDQMAIYIAFLKSVCDEISNSMYLSQKLLNVKNGGVVPEINQDMSLGIYWATSERENKLSFPSRNMYPKYVKEMEQKIIDATNKGEKDAKLIYRIVPESDVIFRDEVMPVGAYNSIEDVKVAVEIGTLNIHDYIYYGNCEDGRIYKNTAGRILFNSLIPGGFTQIRQWYVGDKIEELVEIESLDSVKSDKFKESFAVLEEGGIYKLVDVMKYKKYGSKFKDSVYVAEVQPAQYEFMLRTEVLGIVSVDKSSLDIIHEYIKPLGVDKLAKFVNDEKNFGFKMSTESSVTLSLFDFEPILTDPFIKSRMDEVKDVFKRYELDYNLGFKTREEYESKLRSYIPKEKNTIVEYIKNNLDRNSNIWMIIGSGSRGNFNQLVELTVMIGLPAHNDGSYILQPIFNGYAKGLSSRDYFATGFAGRHGTVVSAIYMGKIGEVSRELNTVSSGDYVSDETCYANSSKVNIRYDITVPYYDSLDTYEDAVEKYQENWNKCVEYVTKVYSNIEPVTKAYSKESILKGACRKFSCTEGKFIVNGKSVEEPIKYKMAISSKNMLMYRTLDYDRMMEEFPKLRLDLNVLKEYSTITSQTIKCLEKSAIPYVYEYLAVNCTCKHGICPRCYGATVYGNKPEYMQMVGIESAQILGQAVSQLALNAHKSSAGNAVNSFSVIQDIVKGQNVGKTAIMMPADGAIILKKDGNLTDIKMVNDKGLFSLSSIQDDVAKEVVSGDFIMEGSLLCYNGSLNYKKLYTSMRKEVNPLKTISDDDLLGFCELVVINKLMKIYDDNQILGRHFDILIRSLCGYGIAKTDKNTASGRFISGTMYAIRDMERFQVEYEPIMISTTKCNSLSGNEITSQGKSHLKMQVGQAAVMNKTSDCKNPFNCIYRGISLDGVYGKDRNLDESKIQSIYKNRQYFVSLRIPEQIVSDRLSRKLRKFEIDSSYKKKDAYGILDMGELEKEFGFFEEDTGLFSGEITEEKRIDNVQKEEKIDEINSYSSEDIKESQEEEYSESLDSYNQESEDILEDTNMF